MELNKLLFFNADGKPYNFWFDNTSNLYKGIILFKKVSVERYSTEIIRIAELQNGIPVYPTSSKDRKEYLAIYWDPVNNFVDEFSVFNYVRDEWITDTSSLNFTMQDGPDVNSVMSSNKEEKYMMLAYEQSEQQETQYIDDDDARTLDINICFNADKRYLTKTFRRTLFIDKVYVNGTTLDRQRIAEITMFAEAEYEDERLDALCRNLGYDVKTSDANIFYESNIHEPIPDMILLNRKRREILLEGADIYRRMGSYSSLIKAIKYYGYDMRIYEFFKDRSTGKKIMAEYPNSTLYPSIDYQRLKYISLGYDITKALHEIDEDGNPKVKEVFDYTIEDACIKLGLLKKKLNNSFMPVNSIIYDITGETINFQTAKINNSIQYDRFDDIKVSDNKAWIESAVNDIIITYDTLFNKYLTEHIGEKSEAELFLDYIKDDKIDNESLDDSESTESAEMSAKLVLRFVPSESDAIEYKNLPISMYSDDISIEDFDVIEKYSMIEWTITDSDGNIVQTTNGTYKDKSLVLFRLKNTGYYTVHCRYFDSYNNMSSVKPLTIYVRPLEIEVNGFYYDARLNPNEVKYNIDQKRYIVDFVYNIKKYIKETSIDEDDDYYPYFYSQLETLLYSTADNINYKVTTHYDDSSESSENNDEFGRLRYVYNGVTVRPYTWIVLSCSITRICGVNGIIWNIYKDSELIKETNKEFLYFLYKDEGDYTITATITDNNGNSYMTERKIQVRNDDNQSSVPNNLLIKELEIMGKKLFII